ncbi:MAG: cupin domain-containing protein [Deltaproteobacteria bacterium]|nr:cupin domain-containing protein [Deltaproteobacteria bacterium]
MQAAISRPFRPIELTQEALAFFSLPTLAEDLRRDAEYEHSGVSAITLTRDDSVTLVLVALRKGASMRRHRAPSAATVVLLSGRVKFVAGDGAETALDPGSLAAFSPDVLHAVEALEDAVYVVIIGGRTRPHQALAEDGSEAGA